MLEKVSANLPPPWPAPINPNLKPTASLSLERSYSDDLSSTVDEREKDVLKMHFGVCFFFSIRRNFHLLFLTDPL